MSAVVVGGGSYGAPTIPQWREADLQRYHDRWCWSFGMSMTKPGADLDIW